MKDPLKIILAAINGIPELQVRQAIRLRKFCEARGLGHPLNVNTAEELIDIMGEYKGQDILLFSNFPPDSSYPPSGESIQLIDEEDYISQSWGPDYYSTSQKLFTALDKRYTFKAIHFITGASEFMLKDEFMKSLFPETTLTIIRKKDWRNTKPDYQNLYRNYIEEKIKEIQA